jgi:hypothetical protein
LSDVSACYTFIAVPRAPMNLPLSLCALVACSFAAGACADPPPKVEQKHFLFHVFGDPGKSVANAELIVSGTTIGRTDLHGTAPVTLSGHEGDSVEVLVRCPAEYQSPTKPTAVSIHHLVAETTTQYEASCPPRARTIVLAVNGMKGYRLPVVQLGRTIGETDDSGVTTILLHAEPNEPIEVSLDTSAPENALLRPRNPVWTFVTKNEDDVVVFDPQLTVAPKPRPTVSRHAEPTLRPVPIRIQ